MFYTWREKYLINQQAYGIHCTGGATRNSLCFDELITAVNTYNGSLCHKRPDEVKQKKRHQTTNTVCRVKKKMPK